MLPNCCIMQRIAFAYKLSLWYLRNTGCSFNISTLTWSVNRHLLRKRKSSFSVSCKSSFILLVRSHRVAFLVWRLSVRILCFLSFHFVLSIRHHIWLIVPIVHHFLHLSSQPYGTALCSECLLKRTNRTTKTGDSVFASCWITGRSVLFTRYAH
jgi:hypothetical protein